MEVLSHSPKETKELARKIAKRLRPGNVLALYGDLGSGKTTFVGFLVKALGFESRVQSPSFTLARKYYKESGDIRVVNHLDFYRLTTKEEVLDIGIEEFINEENSITVIEWPELAEDFLPKDVIKIYFEYKDEQERKINVQDLD